MRREKNDKLWIGKEHGMYTWNETREVGKALIANIFNHINGQWKPTCDRWNDMRMLWKFPKKGSKAYDQGCFADPLFSDILPDNMPHCLCDEHFDVYSITTAGTPVRCTTFVCQVMYRMLTGHIPPSTNAVWPNALTRSYLHGVDEHIVPFILCGLSLEANEYKQQDALRLLMSVCQHSDNSKCDFRPLPTWKSIIDDNSEETPDIAKYLVLQDMLEDIEKDLGLECCPDDEESQSGTDEGQPAEQTDDDDDFDFNSFFSDDNDDDNNSDDDDFDFIINGDDDDKGDDDDDDDHDDDLSARLASMDVRPG